MPIAKAIKNNGGSWFAVANNTKSGKGMNPDGRKWGDCKGKIFSERSCSSMESAYAKHREGAFKNDGGTKQGGDWFGKNCESSMSRSYGSKSPKRKAASAMIAKIPLPLSQYIAKCFKPAQQ